MAMGRLRVVWKKRYSRGEALELVRYEVFAGRIAKNKPKQGQLGGDPHRKMMRRNSQSEDRRGAESGGTIASLQEVVDGRGSQRCGCVVRE